ncbi:MAG: hypothetical protein E7214_06235 [Clostridium sp.]|nr:hypothetical protein [Clostridium sp.]
MKLADRITKKKVTLEEIKSIYKIKEYSELYKLITNLISNNEIIPIKSSGGNGKNPALYLRYSIVSEFKDNYDLIEEINFKFCSNLDMSYYKKNINKYKEHRKYIFQLNEFIKNKSSLLNTTVSMNERSFQIWGREKFIQKEEGKTILKNLKLDLEYLNFYNTSEPLAYYSVNKNSPQNVLILENKDTYYTMRKFLLTGKNYIFDVKIDSVIYGGGKKIIKAFKDYEISVEDYLCNKNNVLYYFGDLDYEGIIIYESLYRDFKNKYDIRPFIKGYEKMLNKASEFELPKTKEGQNRNIKEEFLSGFTNKYRKKVEEILSKDLYIPQEIINIYDLLEE